MRHNLLLTTLLSLTIITGCTYKQNAAASGTHETQTANERSSTEKNSGSLWYYFSETGIHPALNPSEIPPRAFVPWTEAVRVADAAIVNKVPSFLINRLGLMTSASGSEGSTLRTDSLFSSNTAAAIYNTGSKTVIRLYRNSFFSESRTSAGVNPSQDVCLAAYNTETGSFSISLTATDLGLPVNAQCVALDRIGSMWYATFKHEKDNKVEFSYLEFESFPERKEGSASFDLTDIRKLSQDAYRKSVAPFSFSDAPESLKSILSVLPETTSFSLRVYSPVTRSAQLYVRGNRNEEERRSVDGTAFVSDEKTAVLFADGTFYYRKDNSTEKTSILQLPSLSNGYVYTNFILTGKTLLVSWEEQRFFETGRTGLLEITLGDAVY